MSMPELAELMKSLGCHNAINLDGGGSTNMVASTLQSPELHTVNNQPKTERLLMQQA